MGELYCLASDSLDEPSVLPLLCVDRGGGSGSGPFRRLRPARKSLCLGGPLRPGLLSGAPCPAGTSVNGANFIGLPSTRRDGRSVDFPSGRACRSGGRVFPLPIEGARGGGLRGDLPGPCRCRAKDEPASLAEPV